jgi:aryl-alcohol dehydrogenase-like predicted oxidoreductase
MHERSHSATDWIKFLSQIYYRGVDTFHTSIEYESFPILVDAVKAARSDSNFRPKFVVKLADPHFGEEHFSGERFCRRIDEYCNRLSVDSLDCVQWMWRSNLKDDAQRCKDFADASKGEIERTFELLKSTGRVRSVVCFPYSVAFASSAIEHDWVDGLAIYRNPLEVEYEQILESANARGKWIMALRPFSAGGIFQSGKSMNVVRDAISYCFSHTAVRSIVVTFSSILHLEEIEKACSATP